MAHSQPSKLRAWWDENIASKRQSVSVVTLKAIMGRFCGLLSTVSVCSNTKARVEVRTKGEAVGETGKQFCAIVLTPDQLKIFQEKDDTAIGLRGLPGSGKTMLLALKGRYWVKQGHKVVVASAAQSTGGCVPSGVSLHKLIEDGVKESTGTSILPVDLIEVPVSKTFDPQVFDDELAKLGDLPREHVHFLMDEFAYRDTAPQILHYLVHEKRVSVWWAVLHSSDMPQVEGYTYFRLDRAMRSPPSVQRLLKELEWNSEWRDSYTTHSEFEGLPTDGPPIACVRHARHAQPGLLPIECQECAEEIANFLIHVLGVGVSLPVAPPVSALCELSEASTVGHQEMSSSGPDCKIGADDRKKKSKKKQRPKAEKGNFDTAIRFEDVILLFQIPMNMLIKEGDNLYRLVREKFQEFWDNLPSGPFMTKIRKLGLPVIPVFEPCDIAIPSPGYIGVTLGGLAWGLERTVVVFLATDIVSDDTFQDSSVLGNVNNRSQSISTKEESAEISHDEKTSSCSRISSENIITPEDQEIKLETSSPASPPCNVPSVCTEGNVDSSCQAEHVLTARRSEQSSGTAHVLQTTELQNPKVPSANEEATSATATRCPNPCVHTATGTVTGGRTHKGVKQRTEPHFVCEDEIAATVEQGPSDLEAKELEKTGVCEEDDEKTLLELVRKLPTYHQQMLFVAASRSLSQLVLVIPTTWEQ